MNHRKLQAMLPSLAITAILASPALAKDEQLEVRKDFPVKVTLASQSSNGGNDLKIQVTLDIAEGWEVVATPVENVVFEALRMRLQIKGKRELKNLEITFPKGDVIRDEVVGNYRVYRKKAIVQATVQRSEEDRDPLELSLYIQPLNPRLGLCIMPATIRKTLPRGD